MLDQLPELGGRLADLPTRIQAQLFAAFDIQILWNPPMKQATFFATITDTTPGIITALLARAGDDDPTATHPDPGTTTPASTAPATPTSKHGFSVSSRTGICGKRNPIWCLARGTGSLGPSGLLRRSESCCAMCPCDW